jgi:hypothetical protein
MIFRQEDPPTEMQLRRDAAGFSGKIGLSGVYRIGAKRL